MNPLNAPQRSAAVEHGDIAHLSAKDWRDRLFASVHQPEQDGHLYPGFPDEGTQKAFVGSAWEDALDEGFRFYVYVMSHLQFRRFKVNSNRYLDFGCGWGRIGRFFLRDFERGNMAGVDVDPTMVSFCQQAGVPGNYFTVHNDALLPFDDASFKVVTAYSVFTHLPEPIFRKWMAELLRVTAPGGLITVTVEPTRFLDFVAKIDPKSPETGWHAALSAQLGDIDARKLELKEQGRTFLPTGGGPYRPPETYGDMVVTRDYVARCVAGIGSVIAFVDDPRKFWQAVVVIRRNRFSFPFRRQLSRLIER